jgi:signal transduction histidine kinase
VSSPSSPSGAAAPAETLRKLQAVTDAALAHLSLDELLAELLNRVREALDADTCAVLLLDESGGELVARAAKGLEEEVEGGVRIPVGRGFAGRIAAERLPVVIPDVDHSEVLNPILRERGVRSLLGAPLITEGELLGVIHVGTLRPRSFSSVDVELLQVVAHRVALAVHHALGHDERERLLRAQRDFIALAAHELRTPAAAIYGLATTLRARDAELSAGTRAELEDTLSQQAERMRRLVEQLLDLSRLDAAAVRVVPRHVRLKAEIDGIVATVAGDRSEGVIVDVRPELEVTLDPTTIERVVGNLVSNALRHGAVPVTISAAQRDRHVRIVVEDEGHGVADDFVPFLFDRFRRGDPWRETTPEGSGLGLAIARAYARAHGGDVLYAPLRPTGARFELVLPATSGS